MNEKITAKPKGIILFLLVFFLILIFGLSIGFYAKPDIRLFLMLFILFILYGIYHHVKTFTYLKLGRNFIRHGFNSKYTYDEIKKVKLYDYKEYRFLFFPMKDECLTIIFNDGKKVMLQDNYYKNLIVQRYLLFL